ncbi:zinc finger protein 318 [Elysia marginata]|uniref:Zinc finger protein 318 n=1 Tax=Elysia marginata TaxID=1093978 RepID=A0AAV4I1R6_9GAST|nr:zinc finger protein 318 [Elysia marginata]
MSYPGGYGGGYGQGYNYQNTARPAAQGYHGVPPPGPYMGPGGSQYYPPTAPAMIPPPTSQMYQPSPAPMDSGRQAAPPAVYSHYDRSQVYQSPAAPPISRDHNRREVHDWNKPPETSRDMGSFQDSIRDVGSFQGSSRDVGSFQSSSRETGSFQGTSHKSSKKPAIDIDAILKDERLKNVLFSGISKATQKLEESLKAKNSSDNVNFVKEQRKENPSHSQLFPSASNEGQSKPKSILKRSEDRGDIQPDKMSVLEKTLQLLRGKNIDPGQETKRDVGVARPSAALGRLSSYSDDIEDEETHLYGDSNPEKRMPQSQQTNQSKNLPFWSAPSEMEASKRDSGNMFDIKEKLYEEWRNTINTKEPEKTKPEVSQLQAFISSQMSAGSSKKSKSSAPRDTEELDSTVQNILQSIGFNFDLSKRMQELAKQKKKEHDDMQTGIVDQRASFLENAEGIEDMKAKLFSEGSSSIDSFIKQARAETQSSRAGAYEDHPRRSRSPDLRDRLLRRDRSPSRDRNSRYYSRSPERRPPSEWSPKESGDYRRYERRSRSSERSAATPPRSGYSRGSSRGHRVAERFRDDPKDEYYYPDEHEAVEGPPSLPLLKSYSSQKRAEDLSSGLFPSAKRHPPKPTVENFRVMSKAVDDDDGSFTGTRRIIMPSKSERLVVSKSKSPSFRGSQSPYKKSVKRSASPISLRPSKERRYHENQDYGYTEKPMWNDPKYDMKITTFRDRSPVLESVRYESFSTTYDEKDELESRREVSRTESRYSISPERESKKNYVYENQWTDSKVSQERDTYQSSKPFRFGSPGNTYHDSPPRFQSPVWDKDRSPQRERVRSPPKRRSPERRRSPGKRRSPSPMRRKSPSPVRRRSPSPARRRSPSPGRRKSPSFGRRRSPYRKPRDTYKKDSYSRPVGKNSKGGSKYSPHVPFDKTKYSIDRRKKDSPTEKSKKTPQESKVDLSKMSDSERKAHLNKLIKEKEKATVGLAKSLASAATNDSSKAASTQKILEQKKAEIEKLVSAKSEKAGEDSSKKKAEEKKEEPKELQGNLITAIEGLSSLSVEARKNILMKMTRMTQRERQEAVSNLAMRQVKVKTLKAHLDKLKKEQNELMRKSRRSGLGAQDPQLIKNSEEQDKTQKEIEKLCAFDQENPFAEIETSPPPSHKSKDEPPPAKKLDKTDSKAKSDASKASGKALVTKTGGTKPDRSENQQKENWKKITDPQTNELPDVGDAAKKASKSDAAAKEDSKDEKGRSQNASSSSSSQGASQAKVYYEYIDGGIHWCKYCHTKCNSIEQLFEHLHGKKHLQRIQREKKPWKEGEKTSKQQKVGRACTRRIKGSEMLFPVVGFYCALCKVFIPDFADAAEHLKCDSHYNKYMDYLKVNPGHEKKLLLGRRSARSHSRERSPEQQPPPPPTAPPPPPPPPPPPSIKKRQDKDKAKKQLRKSGKEASSGSEDESFEFGADNTTVEDMDLDEEEDQEAVRAAKTKVPKLSSKGLSKGPVATANRIQSVDNMKESKEEKDKPLGQFLSIAEGSDLSKLPVVPPQIDLKAIPIPMGPPTLSEVKPEPKTDYTVKSLKDIDDEEKRMMGIDVNADEEKPLSAIPIPPPSVRKEGIESESDAAQKKPKSLDTLFAKVNSRLAASKVAPKVTAAPVQNPTEMELRIHEEIRQKLLKEKLKMTRKKEREEKKARRLEEPRRKKILDESSSDDSSDEENEQDMPSQGTEISQEGQQYFETQPYSFPEIPLPPGMTNYEAEDEQSMMFQEGLIVLSEVSVDKEGSVQNEEEEEEDDDDGDDEDDGDEPMAFTLAGSFALQALFASNEGSKEAPPKSTANEEKLHKVEADSQPDAQDAIKTSVSVSGVESVTTDEVSPVPPPEVMTTVAEQPTPVLTGEPCVGASSEEKQAVGEEPTPSLLSGRDETSVPPSDVSQEEIASTSMPPEEESKTDVAENSPVNPVEEEGTASLSDLAEVLSFERESTVKGEELEVHKTSDVEAITTSPMEVEAAVVEPTVEAVAVEPTEEAAVLEPTVEAAVVEPTEEAAVLEPTEEAAVLEPTVEAAVVGPTEEAAVVGPIVEAAVIVSTDTASQETDKPAEVEQISCLHSQVEAKSTDLPSPPSLSEVVSTLEGDEETAESVAPVIKRGRGRGKRGAGSGGRGRGRRNVQQQNQETGDQQMLEPEDPEPESPTPTDSVISEQSSGRKRGRGRRGQAAKRTPGRGRVTRSRGIKDEDTSEQDIPSPHVEDAQIEGESNLSEEAPLSAQLEASQGESGQPNEPETAQVKMEEAHERSQVDIFQQEEQAVYVQSRSEHLDETSEVSQAETSHPEAEIYVHVTQESGLTQLTEGTNNDLSQVNVPQIEIAEADKLSHSNVMEQADELSKSNLTEEGTNPPNVTTEADESNQSFVVEQAVELSQPDQIEHAHEPDQSNHREQPLGLNENEVLRKTEVYQAEIERSYEPNQSSPAVEVEEQSQTHEPSYLRMSQAEAVVGDTTSILVQDSSQEDASTTLASDGFDTLSAQPNSQDEFQHEENEATNPLDILDDTAQDLQYQVREQPQSFEGEETDSDATITDDVEELSAPPSQLEGLDTSQHTSPIEPQTWPADVPAPDMPSSDDLVEGGFEASADSGDQTDSGALILQSMASFGSPGMDPPMSGVVSEMDESINAVTLAEEDALLEGEDDAPSAGLSLGLEDSDENEFACAMKDVEES